MGDKMNRIQLQRRRKRVNATIYIEIGGSHPIDRTRGKDLLKGIYGMIN
ncbi:MAG: hypothetical protein Hyperionvirus42_2 [Hyperionvirus sp.]|uniref:Uncharacterized protein n=1 Tax=Hyperionvirus sp. TaxID=2487770 RepID=A0A3G5AC85_9VIRU|nr:MAG: hypothetical protein Hyperionvirus42_2 [Hyperionvirus sp.]